MYFSHALGYMNICSMGQSRLTTGDLYAIISDGMS